MIRSFLKQPVNCFTVGSTYAWEAGVTVTNLGNEERGVVLSPRGKPRSGIVAAGAAPARNNEKLLNARLTADALLDPSAEKVGSTLVLVSGVTYVEVCCGFKPVRALFHDEDLRLNLSGAPLVKRGKAGGSCLLELPEAGGECYPGDAPAIYLRTMNRGDIVIGLTAIERDEADRPVLWVKTLREFSEIARAATHLFDKKILRLR